MKLADFPNIRRDVPLRGFSTFNVGGPANFFYALRDNGALENLLAAAERESVPVFVLGGGSNVLFMDEGFRGLVIRVTANRISTEGNLLHADAGATWPAVLRAMRAAGLGGLEPFDGLPGTVGGAVVGNAGCFGLEIKDVFDSARIYDRRARTVRNVHANELGFAYRFSRIKETHDVVLSVTLRLAAPSRPVADIGGGGNSASNSAGGAELAAVGDSGGNSVDNSVAARLVKQPPGHSSGSFFKNPSPDQPAGLLIDQCGLKGHRIGGAQISPRHGNFFMNMEGATARDLLALRDLARTRVKERFEIELEEEVVIVNANPLP